MVKWKVFKTNKHLFKSNDFTINCISQLTINRKKNNCYELSNPKDLIICQKKSMNRTTKLCIHYYTYSDKKHLHLYYIKYDASCGALTTTTRFDGFARDASSCAVMDSSDTY